MLIIFACVMTEYNPFSELNRYSVRGGSERRLWAFDNTYQSSPPRNSGTGGGDYFVPLLIGCIILAHILKYLWKTLEGSPPSSTHSSPQPRRSENRYRRTGLNVNLRPPGRPTDVSDITEMTEQQSRFLQEARERHAELMSQVLNHQIPGCTEMPSRTVSFTPSQPTTLPSPLPPSNDPPPDYTSATQHILPTYTQACNTIP